MLAATLPAGVTWCQLRMAGAFDDRSTTASTTVAPSSGTWMTRLARRAGRFAGLASNCSCAALGGSCAAEGAVSAGRRLGIGGPRLGHSRLQRHGVEAQPGQAQLLRVLAADARGGADFRGR